MYFICNGLDNAAMKDWKLFTGTVNITMMSTFIYYKETQIF